MTQSDERRSQDHLLSSDTKARIAESFEMLLLEIREHQQNLEKQRNVLLQMQFSAERTCSRQKAENGAGPLPCLTLNKSACIAEIDPSCARLLGEPADKLLGRRFSSFLLADVRESWYATFKAAMAGEPRMSGELALQLADGVILDIHFDCLRLRPDGKPPLLRVALTDISERKLIEQELLRFRHGLEKQREIPSNDWLHGVIEHSLAGIYLIQDGHFAYANQGFADIFGYASPADITNHLSIGELIAPEDRARVAENIRRRAEGEVPEMRYTFVGMRQDGRHIDVEVHGRRMMFEGSPAVIGVILDITERKHAEQQLRIAATAFESQEGMYVTDANWAILRINEAFTVITGYSAAEATGQHPSLLRSGRENDPALDAMLDSVKRTGTWQGEIWNRRKNGEQFPAWLNITAVKNPVGKITNYVGTLNDITARKAAEAEIEYLAFYDQLTQLPNRRLLIDRLQQALASRARSGAEGALLFIDLDNFKDLNDTLGHETGDLLLKQVADRLSHCVRDGDTVARLGGDEFVMMVEGLSKDPDEAAAQSKLIGEKILSALNMPYPIANLEHHSTPSIGVTLFSGRENTADELLKRADLAMYKAKAAGRNTLCFFDPDMQAAVTARTAMETDMRIGLRDGQFLLYYQPQVGSGGCLTGAEALVRWRHPRRGLVSPAEFIPVAEASGLILPLGQWVLTTACKQLVAWAQNPETSYLSMAVNVSARQFHRPDFVSQVLRVLDDTGADPCKLKLELTESLLLNDVEDVIDKMTTLKERGVCFSLDDFGTGYSSLAYLKRLPLDQLKIDQSFVSDVVTSHNDAAITSTIIALAKNLGLSVIAEGVETEGQRSLLASQGCHAYQGYLFGRPEAIEVFERLLKRHPVAL